MRLAAAQEVPETQIRPYSSSDNNTIKAYRHFNRIKAHRHFNHTRQAARMPRTARQ